MENAFWSPFTIKKNVSINQRTIIQMKKGQFFLQIFMVRLGGGVTPSPRDDICHIVNVLCTIEVIWFSFLAMFNHVLPNNKVQH